MEAKLLFVWYAFDAALVGGAMLVGYGFAAGVNPFYILAMLLFIVLVFFYKRTKFEIELYDKKEDAGVIQ